MFDRYHCHISVCYLTIVLASGEYEWTTEIGLSNPIDINVTGDVYKATDGEYLYNFCMEERWKHVFVHWEPSKFQLLGNYFMCCMKSTFQLSHWQQWRRGCAVAAIICDLLRFVILDRFGIVQHSTYASKWVIRDYFMGVLGTPNSQYIVLVWGKFIFTETPYGW